jgi:hypothetical protein
MGVSSIRPFFPNIPLASIASLVYMHIQAQLQVNIPQYFNFATDNYKKK